MNHDVNMDNVFLIGKSHKVCEDYSLSLVVNDIPFLAVSDGCSSSKDTDIGARILVQRAAANSLLLKANDTQSKEILYRRFGEKVIGDTVEIAKAMGVEKDALFATLLVAYIYKDEVVVFIYGDGGFSIRLNGKDMFYSVHLDSNAPYYLIYDMDAPSRSAYEYHFNQPKHICVLKDGEWSDNRTYYDYPAFFRFDLKDVSQLVLTSDGIMSFVSPLSVNPAIEEAIQEVSKFKNVKGEFLKRRVNKMVEDMKAKGFNHQDDLGMAAFIIEKENENIPTSKPQDQSCQ